MQHRIPLPRGWRRHTKSAIVHILALSHYAFTAMVARARERAELAGQFLLANS